MLGEIDPGCRIVAIDPYVLHSRLTIYEVLKQRKQITYLDCSILDDLGTSLQAALQTYHDGVDIDMKSVRTVVLDHVDAVPPDKLTAFLKASLHQLHDDGLFVLYGRTLPHGLLADESLQSLVRILPAESAVQNTDVAKEESAGEASIASHRIEVYAFNGGRVLVDGRPVEDWGGALPYNLFFYIIDKAMVKRQDIFDAFWPDFNPKEATNVFHVTKRKVRKTLYDVEMTRYSNGFYRVSPDVEVYYDVMHFSQLVQDAGMLEGDAQIAKYEQAVRLVRNRFLHHSDETWIKERRRQLEYTVSEVLIELADVKRAAGLLDAALGWYIRALSMNDAREDVVLKIMSVYLALNAPADALTVYNRLRKHLGDEYGVLPGKPLRDLAEEARARLQEQQNNPDDEDETGLNQQGNTDD